MLYTGFQSFIVRYCETGPMVAKPHCMQIKLKYVYYNSSLIMSEFEFDPTSLMYLCNRCRYLPINYST